MNKKILLSVFCSMMLLVLVGCEQGKLPPGPESPDEESAVPLGMATDALSGAAEAAGGAPPCYAPGKVVPAGSFPGVFTVDTSSNPLNPFNKDVVTLVDGKASVTLTFSEDYIWADLLQKREEGGKQVWTQYKWGSDLHADNTNAGECSKPYKCPPTEPNCVSRKGTYTCWLSGKKYTSPTIPLSKQAPQSNIVKCKDPVSNEVVDAAVFLAYTPKGNKKWLVQVVKVAAAPVVQPTLTITSPVEGATVTVAQVKVDFAIANPADKKIKAYIGDAAQTPLLESTATSYTTPALPNGERYIKLEVVNPDGSSLSPNVSVARKVIVNVKAALPEAPGGFEEEEAAPQTGCTKENACKGKNPGDTITCPAGSPSGATCKCKADCEVEVTGGQAQLETCTRRNKQKCGVAGGSSVILTCSTVGDNKLAFMPTTPCSAGRGCIDVTGAECVPVTAESCTKGVCDGSKVKACANNGKLAQTAIDCSTLPMTTACNAEKSTCVAPS